MIAGKQVVDHIIHMAGYIWQAGFEQISLVEEDLPLVVIVAMVVIRDVFHDCAPNEMMCRLDMWEVVIITVIVVQHETDTLVAQY